MTSTTRQEAVQSISAEGALEYRVQLPMRDETRLPEYFGAYVFDDKVQRDRLPGPVYKALRRTIETGAELESDVADAVAAAMKDWAIERGATHYTHWFQPMTGLTAEKHDSFLQPTSDGRAILEFSGSQLVQGEPDASSFPSGGLRATFEARGYTAWDPTSPAFLRKTAEGATLTIPTAFCSWTGEALDKKTPLLRSCEAVSKSATRLLNLIGESNVTRVFPTAGAEQEYFLIDSKFFVLRPDLVSAGRTLFGARPHKGQEFDDHYFGSISQRVLRFMMDLERELWLLGIPIKTRHNEVAPSQFELAPVYSGISVSADQNMLTMEIMRDVAERHGMSLLLHEKPFAGLNGSGKHLNWSLSDNLGNNLFEPGHTPHENLKFVLFLTAILRAVDLHQDLLRASIASSGNDHRLGANEAPPAIISAFLGSQLEGIVESLAGGRDLGGNGHAPERNMIRLGVTALPNLPRDISDRNRTSPFAFTGNKFEFRAVASSQSVAYPAMFLNLIMAESLDFLSDSIEKRGRSEHREHPGDRARDARGAPPHRVRRRQLRRLVARPRVRARPLEPARRLRTPCRTFASDKNIALFEKYRVLTRGETQSRLNVLTEKYAGEINVEALATLDIGTTSILPAALGYQRELAETMQTVAAVASEIDLGAQRSVLVEVSRLVSAFKNALDELASAQSRLEESELEHADLARAYCDEVIPAMNAAREHADALEGLVPDALWPLPKYREMLFIH